MAVKYRTLKNLTETMRNMVYAEKKKDGAFFDAALNGLTYSKKLCQKALTEKNYNAYGEIYDGLTLALADLKVNGEIKELWNLFFELLDYLIKQIEKEENFKKEIVFLPVQAAMWDSLESVWKEFYEDKEHFMTYVVPLPYTNLNRDGSVKERYFEMDKYPSYVPMTYYEDIDLSEMRPKIVFINNPYDDLNYITRVDEKYYSQNLKKYTDNLIYIPYFILPDLVDEEKLEHFVMTGGVVYSDKVIVQSEAMKSHYINILTKKTPWKERSYWENRIMALGSPKIDKVIHSRKEDYELPKEWKKIIEGKKVILYLTSLAYQLNNADKMLDKMRSIFNMFKGRQDVALWWRPHPLMKQSLNSMLPILSEGYLKLEQEYINESIGIYDDTGDLNRAICYSDAYYGDGSSVLTLYSYTDKPYLIENLGIV